MRIGSPRTYLVLATLAILAMAVPAHADGFRAVYSVDGKDVWAVGDAGLIYRSFTGGADWTTQTLGTRTLRAVAQRGFNVVVGGDSGKVWRSPNSGGAWQINVVPGTPTLRAIAMPSDLTVYLVGGAGTITKSGDGGGTWYTQASGTAQTLNAVRFVDETHGWAAGEGGVVLRTSDGGAHWTLVNAGAATALYGIDASGSTVWVVGAGGLARRSTDGGATWQSVNLKLDSRADVRAVWLESPDVVTLAGGGGFIRKSTDGGRTWSWPVHPLQAPISSIHFAAGGAWACSDRTRAVLFSIDNGATWRLPGITNITRAWDQKLSFAGQARGASIALNPVNRSVIYSAFGNTVYRSGDDGDTWAPIGTIPQSAKINAFVVSAKDSNVFVAAVSGIVAKRLVKSDDNGQTWFTTLTHDFGEYGIPIEVDPEHPDTMYFGADGDKLFRSTDCGKNWYRWSTNTFRSPCDIVAVPDTNIILLGDGITGSPNPAEYYKSIDGGQTFTLMSSRGAASEIPGMAGGRLRPSVSFGTNWATGGIQRSPDYGATWPTVDPTGSAWGVDISRDDPNCVVFGVYSGAFTYHSLDGGFTFTPILLLSSNYSFYVRDRATILAEQANGIFKLRVDYQTFPDNTQALTVTAPNGSETWGLGSTHDIRWFAQNVSVARIEYRRSPGDPWELVAEVPGYQQSYAWTLPSEATSDAKIRITDGTDSSPSDTSDAGFSITSGAAAVGADPGASFTLWQNQPNPFTRATRIGYSLPVRAPVRLDVFNLQGQRVTTLVERSQEPGNYSVEFGPGVPTADGQRLGRLNAGVYFYRFQAGSFSTTRKMLLLR